MKAWSEVTIQLVISCLNLTGSKDESFDGLATGNFWLASSFAVSVLYLEQFIQSSLWIESFFEISFKCFIIGEVDELLHTANHLVLIKKVPVVCILMIAKIATHIAGKFGKLLPLLFFG